MTDFKEISQSIKFQNLLDDINIAYTQKNGELKGTAGKFKFIVSIEKNLFLCPDDDKIKGSVINFLAQYMGIGLRDAALILQERFLKAPQEPKRELPNLNLFYCDYLEAYGINKEVATEYEVGFVKQKSIISGKIGFKCYDDNGEVIGYVSFNPKEEDPKKRWFFPQNFKRTLWNAHRATEFNKAIVVCNPFDALILIQKGLKNTYCLIGKSMTASQEETLKKFNSVLLLHPEPDNLILRLHKHCFVKAPLLIQPIKDYSVEKIDSF